MTTAENHQTRERFECSICHEPESDGQQLVSPCQCSGTIRYVHYECISQWITMKSTNKCSVCKTIYRKIDIRQKKRSFFEYLAIQWQMIVAAVMVQVFLLFISLISYVHSVIAQNCGQSLLSNMTFFPSIVLLCITIAAILVSLEVLRSDFKGWQKKQIKYTAVPKKKEAIKETEKETEVKEEELHYNGSPYPDFPLV